jgi:DNA adenine methylase
MYNSVMTPSPARLNASLLPRVQEAAPFVKWVGGKRALLHELESRFPRRFNRYFEPFVGGGAVYYHLQPQAAFLGDANRELVNTYNVVKNDVRELISHLRTHENQEEYFYTLRAVAPDDLSPVERASRLIYLNRTCFNGLYRVNSKGGFNAPFGRYKNPTICNEQGLLAASGALQSAHIAHQPYQAILDEARLGDFVYMDPPYHPLSATASFTSYTAGSFGARDQEELAQTFRALDARGTKVMLSNSDTPFIHALYADYHIERVMAPRMVNRNGAKRGPISELIIRNYRR